MPKLRILPHAWVDWSDAMDWYAQRSERKAEEFEAEVDSAFDEIASDPDRFPRIDRTFRYCMLRKFPYRIVFRVMPEHALVIAIAHHKRRPYFWRRRPGTNP